MNNLRKSECLAMKKLIVATKPLLQQHCGPLCGAVLTALVLLGGMPSYAQDAPHSHAAVTGTAPAPFVASTAKPFSQLMDDAMAVMDHDMRAAPMNGSPEHDFVSMMIPHHMGAVNMAKALLLSSEDPELRNLAQAIITEQENEIRVMQAWQKRFVAQPAHTQH